jgi:hypothetical protein
MDEAMGIDYLVIRRPDGSFFRATDTVGCKPMLDRVGRLHFALENVVATTIVVVPGIGRWNLHETLPHRVSGDDFPTVSIR